jgi:hypothetical protein
VIVRTQTDKLSFLYSVSILRQNMPIQAIFNPLSSAARLLRGGAVAMVLGMLAMCLSSVAIAVARTTAGVVKVVNVMEIVSDDETRRLDNQVLGARSAPPQSAPVENR